MELIFDLLLKMGKSEITLLKKKLAAQSAKLQFIDAVLQADITDNDALITSLGYTNKPAYYT